MDSTQQAERKSMNKSLAFARASHDIRASLSAITGLIEICSQYAKPNTNLQTNLVQMYTTALDLLGILNSVLDTSKIEAGKMQLEEEEFDLAELVQDVVDMFHPLGVKKGVDVVYDSWDCSILKFNPVKGDKGKIKQIFCNLLSNAIKFTSEGHITVRALVRKKSKENEIIASNQSSVLSCLSRMFYRKNGSSFSTLDTLHTGQENHIRMEYIFDVDDTGKGIPKEKQKSVFENFVQVKETALGQEGCGLGLGIVQSLVRLMGGEIKILEKENGEKGTCFGFNMFLPPIQPVDTEGQDDGHQTEVHRYFGLQFFRSPSPRLEGSYVVLLISGEERRRISKRVIENLGGAVEIVKQSLDLSQVLETVKKKMDLSQCSFSDDLFPNEESSSTKDEIESQPKRSHSKCSSSSILVVIDARCGPFSVLCSILANFRKDVQTFRCKVVWLEDPVTRNITKELEDGQISLPPCDHFLSKPFHGSHLYGVLALLPEFAARIQPNMLNLGQPPTIGEVHYSSQPFSSSAEGKTLGVPVQDNELDEVVIHKNDEENNKILNGKNVLVVDDNKVLCTIATKIIQKLGAKTETCENGKDAVDLICKNLQDDQSSSLPFDFIFMDCQMPVMDGYEATKLIRKEEKVHGIHIPIIALTACSTKEEIEKTLDAGMDFHLAKPILTDKLMKVIKRYS
ncbi:hypothetical protein RD792_006051 [Penstemon davidsonii]|uniref:histidine kinase n=1 Tax=Penstemon davidsonii TaxID=160366 RepID=A0ABR0DDM4_9LAMI|nr:hypothetical protein RD792_006051 [Penstemon davidsonii]